MTVIANSTNFDVSLLKISAPLEKVKGKYISYFSYSKKFTPFYFQTPIMEISEIHENKTCSLKINNILESILQKIDSHCINHISLNAAEFFKGKNFSRQRIESSFIPTFDKKNIMYTIVSDNVQIKDQYNNSKDVTCLHSAQNIVAILHVKGIVYKKSSIQLLVCIEQIKVYIDERLDKWCIETVYEDFNDYHNKQSIKESESESESTCSSITDTDVVDTNSGKQQENVQEEKEEGGIQQTQQENVQEKGQTQQENVQEECIPQTQQENVQEECIPQTQQENVQEGQPQEENIKGIPQDIPQKVEDIIQQTQEFIQQTQEFIQQTQEECSPQEIVQEPTTQVKEIIPQTKSTPQEVDYTQPTPTPSLEETPQTPTPSLEETPQTPTPSLEETPQTPTPSLEETPQTPDGTLKIEIPGKKKYKKKTYTLNSNDDKLF